MELSGIEANVSNPSIKLIYEWESLPVSNMPEVHLRLQLANDDWGTGPYLQFADNTAYFDLTPNTTAGERTITKQLAKPLSYYMNNITPPNGDPYNTPVRFAFSLRVMLGSSTAVPTLIGSDSEDWSTELNISRSGYWYRVNNEVGGRLRRLGGENDLEIHLRIIGQ